VGTDGAMPLLRRVRLGGVDLAYRLGGAGPAVLLVHGSWEDHRTWDRVAAQLRATCTVLVYDRRGHSASTAPPGQGRIAEDVEDAAALLRHLGLGPATVVGHSYGSSVALLLAMRHPELTARLVVHEPPLFAQLAGHPTWEQVAARSSAVMAEVARGLEAGETEAAVRRFVEQVGFGPGSWDGLFDDRGRATALANADTWLDQSRDPERLAVDLTPLRDAPVPVTVTSGSASLPAYPEIARRVVAALPTAELVVVPGAGHGVQLSHPAAFAELVRARAVTAPR
jgi:esterase